MDVFFINWELWQEMTFILGCCIILVFLAGLVKLWSTNRSLRRLEIIDEEKRARVTDMSHCGLDICRPPEIPFGVRAIQNGVEVEGIWISRSNTPEGSQVALFATLVADCPGLGKGKGRLIGRSPTTASETCPISDSANSRRKLLDLPSTMSLEVPSGKYMQGHIQAPDRLGPPESPPKFHVEPHIPTGTPAAHHRNQISASSVHDPPIISSQIPAQWLSQTSALGPDGPESVEVVINRSTRWANRVHEGGRAGQQRLDRIVQDENDTSAGNTVARMPLSGRKNDNMIIPVRAKPRKTTGSGSRRLQSIRMANSHTI